MNGNRGAKGSVNDRVISMLYQARYKEYLKRKEFYTKEEKEKQKEYLKKLQELDIDTGFDSLEPEDKIVLETAFAPLKDTEIVMPVKTGKISSIQEIVDSTSINPSNIDVMVNTSAKISEFDPATEIFDFDKYDYYETIVQKTGLADVQEDEIIDVSKEEEKTEDEITIIEELSEFITDSKELLSEIKFEINDIKASIEEQYTIDQLNKLDEKYQSVKEKLDKLRKQYLTMKEKYDFEDYELLESIALIDAIEDYKTKAKLDELETLVNACKEEVEAIDGVLIEEQRRVGIGEDIADKREEITIRDHEFEHAKGDTIYLTKIEREIAEEAQNQRKIIQEIETQLAKVETEVVHTTEYVYNTGRMFSSFLRIAAGVLTAPLSRTHLFGTMLGTHLINRGLRDLRTSLMPREVNRVELRERYQSMEREILNTKDVVGTTMKLLNDSIYQVNELKKDFKLKFEKYASYIPEYYKVSEMMDELELKMTNKKVELNKMEETLDKQYESNKQKVLRAS